MVALSQELVQGANDTKESRRKIVPGSYTFV